MLICAQDAAYKHYSIHYLLYVDLSFAATLLSWTEDKLLKVILIHGKLIVTMKIKNCYFDFYSTCIIYTEEYFGYNNWYNDIRILDVMLLLDVM